MLASDEHGVEWYNGNSSWTVGMVGTGAWTAVAACDVDADGDVDVLSAGKLGVALHLNDGTGQFLSETLNDAQAESVRCADIDGDNDPDALVALPNAAVWLANENGVLSTAYALIQGRSALRDASAADMNQDNYMDVVSVSALAGIGLSMQLANGTFSEIQHIFLTTGDFPLFVDLVDFDGDGHLDIVTSCISAVEVLVFTADPKYPMLGGEYIPQKDGDVILVESLSRSLALGRDLDSDDIVDIVYMGSESNTISWYKFAPRGSSPPYYRVDLDNNASNVRDVDVADLDRDGYLDVIATGPRFLKWYKFLPDSPVPTRDPTSAAPSMTQLPTPHPSSLLSPTVPPVFFSAAERKYWGQSVSVPPRSLFMKLTFVYLAASGLVLLVMISHTAEDDRAPTGDDDARTIELASLCPSTSTGGDVAPEGGSNRSPDDSTPTHDVPEIHQAPFNNAIMMGFSFFAMNIAYEIADEKYVTPVLFYAAVGVYYGLPLFIFSPFYFAEIKGHISKIDSTLPDGVQFGSIVSGETDQTIAVCALPLLVVAWLCVFAAYYVALLLFIKLQLAAIPKFAQRFFSSVGIEPPEKRVADLLHTTIIAHITTCFCALAIQLADSYLKTNSPWPSSMPRIVAIISLALDTLALVNAVWPSCWHMFWNGPSCGVSARVWNCRRHFARTQQRPQLERQPALEDLSSLSVARIRGSCACM